MRIKGNKGFVGIDMAIAITAIIIFSGLIVSMMYNNALENLKTRNQALATIYLTQTLENIGIAQYSEISKENINMYIPTESINNGYTIEMELTEELELNSTKKEDIIKKISATITYKVANKNYQISMERTKIKE